MLCREIVAVCYLNGIIALCESVQSSFSNAAGGTYNNRCILQCYVLSGPPERSLHCSPDDYHTSVMKYPPWMRRWMDCRRNKGVSEFRNVRDLGPPMHHCQDRNQATEKYSQIWRSIVCKWTTTFCYISMPLVAAFQAYLTSCLHVVTKYAWQSQTWLWAGGGRSEKKYCCWPQFQYSLLVLVVSRTAWIDCRSCLFFILTEANPLCINKFLWCIIYRQYTTAYQYSDIIYNIWT